ncbi:MAG: endonuclease V [Planctomycetales bacterium]
MASSLIPLRTPRQAILPELPDLGDHLADLLRQIPPGRVTTYGALARALGSIVAARWVATWINDPSGPSGLPRHRVVLQSGELGRSRNGDEPVQQRLLRAEGIEVGDRGVDLERCGFDGFQATQPLAQLQTAQVALAELVDSTPPTLFPEFVAGVDVSYAGTSGSSPVYGFAAYVLVHIGSGETVWSLTMRRTIRFPYIPGFLAFREAPILCALLDEVRSNDRLADVVLVDGNGRLHHRHSGVACHVGVVAGIPTIGVGKSLLCGTADVRGMRRGESRPVMLHDQIVAHAWQTAARGRPIYISAGHRMNLETALRIVQRVGIAGRIPSPIQRAHLLSRKVAKCSPSPRHFPMA